MEKLKAENNIKYRRVASQFPGMKQKQVILLAVCFLSLFLENYTLYQIQGLVDAVINGQSLVMIHRQSLWMLILGLLSFMVDAYQMQYWHTFSKEMENRMRCLMVKNFFYKDIAFTQSKQKGNLASQLLNDGNSVAGYISLIPLMMILNIARILSILVILGTYSLKLTFIVLLLTPLYAVATILLNGRMRKYSRQERESFGYVQGTLMEMIQGFKEIKIFNKENYFSQKFEHLIFNDYFSHVRNMIHIQILSTALSSYIRIIFPILILWCGAYFSSRGEITVGMLVAFYTYIAKLVEPMNNLGDIYQGSKQAQGALDRIYDFLLSTKSANEGSQTLKYAATLEVQIDHFGFEEHDILQNIHICLQDQDRLFIGGESGSGKSTILNLILKQYQDFQGNIRVNGKDYQQYTNSSYYDRIIAVFQEPLLFAGTIRENLTLGDNFSDEDICQVLYTAGLNEFMMDKTLDDELSENAGNLSGGQKQRLALARALLRKPDILILDEVTSGLDQETEETVIGRLDSFLKKHQMKLICVSHRPLIEQICTQSLYLTK